MSSAEPLRIGILGCAGIAFKSATAILQKESGCKVTAVASRSADKANNFVKDIFGDGADAASIKVFGGDSGYDDLIQSDAVDALYIPLPTTLHKQWVLKALRGQKHIVLEKPVAVNASDYEEMLQEAYKQNKFILDGTMFPHHPRTQAILDAVTSDKLGAVDRIEANFTFMTDAAFQDTNIRGRKDGDLLGAIGDLGWYCVRFAQMVYASQGKKPLSVQVVDFDLTKHEVPLDATCVVRFEGDSVLWFHCGFKTAYRQRFEICGSSKSLMLDDLVLPVKGPVSHTLKSSGLTNYALLTTNDVEEVKCEDCPVHEVLLWSAFSKIVKDMMVASSDDSDATKWTSKDEGIAALANKFAATTLENQQIVDGLIQSLENGCKKVDL